MFRTPRLLVAFGLLLLTLPGTSAASTWILAGGPNGATDELRVVEVAGDRLRGAVTTSIDADVRGVALSRNHQYAAVITSSPNQLRVYRVSGPQFLVVTSINLPYAPTFVSINDTTTRVGVASGADLHVFDILGGPDLGTVRLGGLCQGVAAAPGAFSYVPHHATTPIAVQGPFVVAADRRIALVDPDEVAVMTEFPTPPGVQGLRVTADGNAYVMTSSEVRAFRLFDGDDLGAVADTAGPVWDVSADGQRILVAIHTMAETWDAVGHRRVTTTDLHEDILSVVALDVGATLVASTRGVGSTLPSFAVRDTLTGALGSGVTMEYPFVASIESSDISVEVGALASDLAGLASQGSVDDLTGIVSTNLDVAVSTRATQASVNALATSVGTRASQSSVDAIATSVGMRATQSSVDSLVTSLGSRASQSSVDALTTRVDTRASQTSVDSLASTIGSRASQSSVDAVASDVASIDATVSDNRARLAADLDAPVSTRATQASLDALTAQEADDADRAADDHARLLARVGLGSRQGIEAALVAGALQPLFFVPAGPDGDPAAVGTTCPGLAAAGHAGIDEDGLFETVRCVTRRAIDNLAAIGEDVHRAEDDFTDGEDARTDDPPRYRDAVGAYSRALETALRGH